MKKIIYLLIFFLIITRIGACTIAEEPSPQNSKGICDAWYSTNGIAWNQSTVRDELKLGQIFYIKTYLKSKIDLNGMSVSLHNLGGPPYDFLIVEKPGNIPEKGEWTNFPNDDGYYIGDIIIYNVKAGEEYSFIWKLRVNPESNWTNASSPVNLYAGFTIDGTDSIKFTVVDIFIKNEIWEEYVDKSNESLISKSDKLGSNQNSLGFEVIMSFLALFVIIIFINKKIRFVN